jgi:hypothetical protein
VLLLLLLLEPRLTSQQSWCRQQLPAFLVRAPLWPIQRLGYPPPWDSLSLLVLLLLI